MEGYFLWKLLSPQKGPWQTSIWGLSKEKAIFLFLSQHSHLLIIPTHVLRAFDNLFSVLFLIIHVRPRKPDIEENSREIEPPNKIGKKYNLKVTLDIKHCNAFNIMKKRYFKTRILYPFQTEINCKGRAFSDIQVFRLCL